MLKKNVFIDTIDQMMVKSLLKEEQIPRYFFTTGSVVSGGKNDSGSSVNVLIDLFPPHRCRGLDFPLQLDR